MFGIIKKHFTILLLCLLFFSFITRIVNISTPPKYMFDEVYHALTAKLISRNDPRAYEWWNPAVEPDTAVDWLHPPIAKYFQALGILLFGENVVGWRFSSVVFGTLVIFLVVRLTDTIFANKPLALLAGFLASLDGLLLAQSRIAMNDIHVTFFILLTLLFYAKHRNLLTHNANSTTETPFLFLTGLASGLAVGTKWSGIYVLLPIFIFEAFLFLERFKKTTFSQKFLFILKRIVLLGLIPTVVYILSYSHMFSQGKSLFCTQDVYIQGECYYEIIKDSTEQNILWEGYVSHFIALHRQIWWYQTNLEAEHPYGSRPIEWFLNLKPVWFHVDYQGSTRADIYAQGNTVLFWLGALATVIIVFVLLSIFIKTNRTKRLSLNWNQDAIKLLFVLVAYCSVWMLWQFSPRIMFFYHYTPAVPLLSILLAIALYYVWKKDTAVSKISAILMVLAIVINFALFYPHWTGMFVPIALKESLYFALDSWR